jgi:hypothetical protein
MKAIVVVLGLAVLTVAPQRASAWGDDGHKTVALIAQHYLTPAVKMKIDAMLAADTDNLTKHDFASAATWADKYRDSNNRKDHYQQTQQWHFVDIEIENADIGTACFGRFPLLAGTLASNGPPKACVVDKPSNSPTSWQLPAPTPKNGFSLSSFCCTSWAICISRCTPRTTMIEVETR